MCWGLISHFSFACEESDVIHENMQEMRKWLEVVTGVSTQYLEIVSFKISTFYPTFRIQIFPEFQLWLVLKSVSKIKERNTSPTAFNSHFLFMHSCKLIHNHAHFPICVHSHTHAHCFDLRLPPVQGSLRRTRVVCNEQRDSPSF